MTLKESKNGKEYIVEESMLKQPQRRRLEAMGLIEGTRIRKINEALDGSIVFMVRGSRLAISKELAEDILVRDLTSEDLIKKKRMGGLGKGPRDGRGMGRGIGPGPRDGRGMGRGRGVNQCGVGAEKRGIASVGE